MANRRLYNEKSFLVESLGDFKPGDVWHLVGRFTTNSIVSNDPLKEYRIMIKSDPRWKDVRKVAFRVNRVYEYESNGRRLWRHIYGSWHCYISPFRPKGKRSWEVPGEFKFDDFDVTVSQMLYKERARLLSKEEEK
ncbi:MAG: hypothetical protein Q7S12_00565 [bacterium]|nr:hypothetical protein [bacterium]